MIAILGMIKKKTYFMVFNKKKKSYNNKEKFAKDERNTCPI